ncbi:hypothetical protein ILUMI_15601, partial [Ignelater luminosus]
MQDFTAAVVKERRLDYQKTMEEHQREPRTVYGGKRYKLVYLDRVIKEALRIFSAASVLRRTAAADIKLDKTDCIIPAGCEISLSFISLHRDPELWPDPLKFDPDHFLPDEIAKRHPYRWMPFSGGSRNCP